MRKWISLLEIIVLCILVAGVTVPISLASPNKLEFEGKILGDHVNFRNYLIGELHRGDTVRVVITDIRGNSSVRAGVGQTVFSTGGWDCYFPSERTFTIPTDGTYSVYIIAPFVRPTEERVHVFYKGYVEW